MATAAEKIPPNATLEQRYVRCGKSRCERCRTYGAAHGPYWYAYWKEGRRVRSRYLGANVTGTTFAKTPANAADAAVLRLVTKYANGRTGLAFVPQIVRELGGPEVAHPLLERLSREGRLELRPESGLARLKAEELRLALPGPQGTRLTWMRRVS